MVKMVIVSFILGMWYNIAIGATYYVATSGNDSNPGTETESWLTLDKAETVAIAGDTVFIKSGTYQEQNLNPVNTGTPDAPITFKAYGDGEVIIDPSRVVTGWTLTSGLTNTYEASFSGAISDIWESNNVWLSQQTSIYAVDDNPGTYFISGGKIYFHTTDDSNPNTKGIYIYIGINQGIRPSSYTVIEGFTIKHALYGIQLFGNTNATIRNCKVWYTSGSGILLQSSSNSNTITGNIVVINKGSAMAITTNCINNVITHNVFTELVQLDTDVTSNTFKNNIIYSLSVDAGSTSNIFDYNNYYRASGNMISWSATVYTISQFSSYQQATGKDTHSIAVDPLFVNPGTGDFHLQAVENGYSVDSLCIDAGEISGEDIGAYNIYTTGAKKH